MKKLITVAALLAAGTALSNAATIDDAFVSLTGDAVVSSTSLADSGKSGLFSLTIALKDSAISYFGDYISSNTSVGSPNLAVLNTANHDLGIRVGYSSQNSIINAGGLFISYDGTAGESTGNFAGGQNFFSDLAWDNVTGMALTLTTDSNLETSANGSYAHLYITATLADGTATTYAVDSATNLHWSRDALTTWESLALDTAYVASAYLFCSTLTQQDAFFANTAAIAAVPEPSAFGLLAGIGALALVAARRRRK